MKKDVDIRVRDHIIHVAYGNEFATMTRLPNDEGVRNITFSFTPKGAYADLIDGSGIASVKNINYDECIIAFKSQPFYETHLMAEIIVDILQKHETENS
jgi:hypothetical protein